MHETKIEMKLEEEMKPLKKICETLEEAVKHEFEKGIECVNVEEMGEVIDMLKDIYEAKEKLVKGCYYKQIMTAMEKSEKEDEREDKYFLEMLKKEYKDDYEKMREEYGEGEETDRRFYDNYRYKSSGRFAPRGRGSYMPRSSGRRGRRGYEEMPYMIMPEMYDPEMMRDMDRMDGRMYYSGGGSSNGSSGGNSGSGSYSGNSGGNSGGSSSGMSGGNSGSSSRGYSEGYNDGEESGYQRGYSEGRRSGSRGGNRDGREGRSGQSRRSYMETKEMNKGNTPEEKRQKMTELEKYMGELGSDISEMISDASQEEKNLLKQKLQMLTQKIS